MRTFLITKVNPSYPTEAERQHVDGPVLLRISVDKSGNVSKVEPVSGHPLLIPAAIDAVKQWKYKPYLLNQKPIEVETTVLIKFVISDGNAYSVIAFARSPESEVIGLKSPITSPAPAPVNECNRLVATHIRSSRKTLVYIGVSHHL